MSDDELDDKEIDGGIAADEDEDLQIMDSIFHVYPLEGWTAVMIAARWGY
jgi:hypothetical protein